MEFFIGQTFEKTAPPEAAEWCDNNNARIEKVDGVRTIVKNPPPPKTKEVRTFSKFGIWVATRNLPIAPGSEFTVWETFETFLSEQKLMSGWAQLVDLVEDNPFFEEFYPKAVETFGKDLVDNVLAASVVGTKTVIVEG